MRKLGFGYVLVAACCAALTHSAAALGQTPDNGAPPESPAAEAPVVPNLFEVIGKALNPPSPPGVTVQTPRVLRGSGSRAGGPANELNTGGQVEAPEGELRAVLTGKALFHGNYCGKGQRGADLPPIDALDAACQRHDVCYDQAGYASCACDGVLRQDASLVADDRGVPAEVRRRALSVLEAAGAMACRTP